MFWLDTRVRSGPARVCSLGTGPTHFRSGVADALITSCELKSWRC